MKITTSLIALMIAGSTVLSGCASTNSSSRQYDGSQPDSSTYGTIDAINAVNGGGGTSGAGAVVGGLIGALAGNQIGSGGGRTAATLVGAAGGAVAGNEVEKNRDQGKETFKIRVRLDNGNYRDVVQDNIYDLRPGNRVRVIDGHVYRY